MTDFDKQLKSFDDITETLESSQKEISMFGKMIKILEKFEDDLQDVDNLMTEQVTVNNLIKKSYQSLVNLMNRNSARLKQKQSVEAKIDSLDENIKILASIMLKECSQNHSN